MSAEESQGSVNPYAAPQALPAGAEEPAVAVVPFGLQEPLRATGTLQPEHMRQAIWPVMGRRLRLAQIVLILNSAVGTWLAFSSLMLILCVFGLVLLGLAELILRTRVRWSIRDQCGREAHFQFSESGIRGRSATAEYWCAWSSYTRCICGETLVVLCQATGSFLVVPRCFFAVDSDWYQFVALVQHKLSKRSRKAATHSTCNGAESWRVAAEEAPVGTLSGAGRLRTRDGMVATRRLPGQRWLGCLRVGLVFVMLIAILSVMVLGHFLDAGNHLILGTLGGIAALFALLVPRLHYRRLERRGQPPFTDQTVVMTEQYVQIHWPQAHSKAAWEYYAGYCLLPNHLLLCHPSRGTAHILPRPFFAEADWPKVVEVVQRKLPPI